MRPWPIELHLRRTINCVHAARFYYGIVVNRPDEITRPCFICAVFRGANTSFPSICNWVGNRQADKNPEYRCDQCTANFSEKYGTQWEFVTFIVAFIAQILLVSEASRHTVGLSTSTFHAITRRTRDPCKKGIFSDDTAFYTQFFEITRSVFMRLFCYTARIYRVKTEPRVSR